MTQSRKIVCTQQIVDTMLKDLEIKARTGVRSHRTYTKHFKEELVAACQLPGASIAGIASAHGMNANVLHRWLREHQLTGCHGVVGTAPKTASQISSRVSHPAPAFVALSLPGAIAKPVEAAQTIKVEIRRGPMQMSISWPLYAASDFASWAAGLLR